MATGSAPRERSRRSATGSGVPADGGQRAQLTHAQRARILASATQIVAELGYVGLTVSEIVVRARISRRTFYELFADREQCFLAAFDAALTSVAAPVLAAYEESGRPASAGPSSLRAGS